MSLNIIKLLKIPREGKGDIKQDVFSIVGYRDGFTGLDRPKAGILLGQNSERRKYYSPIAMLFSQTPLKSIKGYKHSHNGMLTT